MALAIAAILSFLNAFLGFGFVWIGKFAGEALVAALFFVLAFVVGRYAGRAMAFVVVGLPALPIALLIVQFRDNDGSHLGGIAIVLAWLLGIVLGTFAGGHFYRPAKQQRAAQ